MANRVAIPLVDAFGYMRTAISGNDPNVVDHFCFDGHVSGTLDNLQVAVIGRGKQGRSHVRPSQTPRAQGQVLRAVELVSFGLSSYFRKPLASVRRQGRNRPLRPHNDWRSPVPGELSLAPVQAELGEIVMNVVRGCTLYA